MFLLIPQIPQKAGSLHSWWGHNLETLAALLALCEGNPPVTGGFSSQSRNAEFWCQKAVKQKLGLPVIWHNFAHVTSLYWDEPCFVDAVSGPACGESGSQWFLDIYVLFRIGRTCLFMNQHLLVRAGSIPTRAAMKGARICDNICHSLTHRRFYFCSSGRWVPHQRITQPMGGDW